MYTISQHPQQSFTVANVPMLQPWDLHSVDKKRKRTKCILFFFLPRGHHFKMSCCGCEFLSASPLLLCLEANPLISCVSMDLQKTFLYEKKKKEREEDPLHFLYFLCLSCTTTSNWLQCYCALFMKDDLNLM